MTKSAKNKNNIVIKGWVFAGALAIWAIFIIVFMFRINIVEGVELERFAEKNNFRFYFKINKYSRTALIAST